MGYGSVGNHSWCKWSTWSGLGVAQGAFWTWTYGIQWTQGNHSKISPHYNDPARSQNHNKQLGCRQSTDKIIFEQRFPSGIAQSFVNHPLLGYPNSCYPPDHVVMTGATQMNLPGPSIFSAGMSGASATHDTLAQNSDLGSQGVKQGSAGKIIFQSPSKYLFILPI